MLNQLIYTRCMPHRELKNKGQVVRADGFGIFSMSQGMITNPPVSNFDLLQSRLAVQNGAKETSAVGLFNSYEYTALEPNVYAFSYEVARPHCKEPRKNGQGHRTGTYIKQCFVGNAKGYPCMWFGASTWDAHMKSENDYYLDENPNAIPEILQFVQDSPDGGYITIDKIKKFVNDGRIEAVKCGIWFIVQEYSKPECERKVLLIKDIPENVELWIAAIEYAFSSELARTITFSTNKTKLGTQVDNALFYYTDESGKFYPMLNRSIAQVRHPYHMIVGFHPKDTFCSSVKQMPVSNFVIIDGMTKAVGFTPDASIKSSYYSAAVQYDADIMDFCDIVLPSLPVKGITDKIPALYEAYKYLLDSNHKVEKWNYRDTINALRSLIQFGIPENDALNNYILNEGLRGYQKFVAVDEKNGFGFLKILWDIGGKIRRNREVAGCLADRLSMEMMNLKGAGNALMSTWEAVKGADIQKIVQPVLDDLFNDAELACYSNQFDSAPSSSVYTIMCMYYETISRGRGGLSSVMDSNDKYRFVCLGLIALIDDENALRIALDGIGESSSLVNTVALTVYQYFEQHKPEKTEIWWDAIIDFNGGSVVDLCRTLCKSSETSIDMIERLLANSIVKTNRCDQESVSIFKESIKLLGKNENTGVAFYTEWIKAAKMSELDHIIRAIRGSGLSVIAEKKLFKIIDSVIPSNNFSGKTLMTFRSMKEWANDIGEVSVCVALNDLKSNLEHERKSERAISVMHEFSCLKLSLPSGFTSGDYFRNIVSKSAEFCDGEVHMAFLNLFEIQDDRDKQQYVKAYVREVLDGAKGKQMVRSMISLCEASCNEYKIQKKEAAQVKELSEMLDKCFSIVLPDYYKANMIDQVEKINDCDMKVKMRLTKILKDVGQKEGTKGGLGGFFGNIFRKL